LEKFTANYISDNKMLQTSVRIVMIRVMEKSVLPTKVRLVQIDADHLGQRIDNYLLTELKGVPKSRIYRILRKGEVRVNGGRIKPTYRLQLDDTVRIPPVRIEEREKGQVPHGLQRQLQEAVLYEDERFLVLNKPSGMAVHAGSGIEFGVIEVLRSLRGEGDFLELVHRLDRETSGCLLVAKQRETLLQLNEKLQGGGVEKHYLALLRGDWQGGMKTVNVSLQKNSVRGGERMVMVSVEGKEALSYFKPLRRFEAATLVDVEIKTGRTHQIRVHAAHFEQPLAGDQKYGNKGFNRQLKKLGLKRLFLHAERLSFSLHKPFEFCAPLPEALQRLLNKLD